MENLIISCDSTYYWNSYSHFDIHEEMIKDTHRTSTYKNALSALCKDKVVMDVGCGTGILSMFAAQAGAKKVYAVEMSDIADYAKEIVKKNGFEGIIEVIKGRVETIEIPIKVDIIVSEWMGYNLLYEGMLPSVLTARRFLNTDGIILPNKCSMFITAITGDQECNDRIKQFQSIYGDISIIKSVSTIEPSVEIISKERVVSSHFKLIDLDIKTMEIDEVDFTKGYDVTINTDAMVTGFCCYFDCEFMQKGYLTTRPGQNTHWKQTLFFFKKPIHCSPGDCIKGTYRCSPCGFNPRHLDISIEYSYKHYYDLIRYYMN
ncbi:type I protein arginine methyltransferase [Entamoeba marina]